MLGMKDDDITNGVYLKKDKGNVIDNEQALRRGTFSIIINDSKNIMDL
ncbi:MULTISPECIES: hypothetical protein [Bacillaceae]|nr:hypothetical protein [Bacillus sp. PK3_68]